MKEMKGRKRREREWKSQLESKGEVGGPPQGNLAQGLGNFIMVYSDLLRFQPMLDRMASLC